MLQLNLKSLIAKLNPLCKRTLEGAAGLCLSRTHYNVEIEHWLLKLLDESKSDLEIIFRHYGVDVGRLQADLNKTLDGFKTGNARPPALSPNIVALTPSFLSFSFIQRPFSSPPFSSLSLSLASTVLCLS